MRAQSVDRYAYIVASSIISLFLDLYFYGYFFWHAHKIPYAMLAIITIIRSICEFSLITHVEGVGVNVKGLLQALAICGLPAMCSSTVSSVLLGVPPFFGESNPSSYSQIFFFAGTAVQEFLRSMLYSQAIRGIPWRAPLAIAVLGWHILMGLVRFPTPLAWFTLYWLVVSTLAYLVFRAEKR